MPTILSVYGMIETNSIVVESKNRDGSNATFTLSTIRERESLSYCICTCVCFEGGMQCRVSVIFRAITISTLIGYIEGDMTGAQVEL